MIKIISHGIFDADFSTTSCTCCNSLSRSNIHFSGRAFGKFIVCWMATKDNENDFHGLFIAGLVTSFCCCVSFWLHTHFLWGTAGSNLLQISLFQKSVVESEKYYLSVKRHQTIFHGIFNAGLSTTSCCCVSSWPYTGTQFFRRAASNNLFHLQYHFQKSVCCWVRGAW